MTPIDDSPPGSSVSGTLLLHCRKVKSESEVAQSCPTLSGRMDCSLSGFSVHGIFQASVLEWGAIAFSTRSLSPSLFCGVALTFLNTILKASLVAQMVKPLPAVRETWVRSLGWKDPLEKEMATHSSILAWRIPGTEEPGGLPSMGSHRVGHN